MSDIPEKRKELNQEPDGQKSWLKSSINEINQQEKSAKQ